MNADDSLKVWAHTRIWSFVHRRIALFLKKQNRNIKQEREYQVKDEAYNCLLLLPCIVVWIYSNNFDIDKSTYS